MDLVFFSCLQSNKPVYSQWRLLPKHHNYDHATVTVYLFTEAVFLPLCFENTINISVIQMEFIWVSRQNNHSVLCHVQHYNEDIFFKENGERS